MKLNKLAVFTLALSFSLPLANLKAYAFVPAEDMRDLSSNHWAYKAIESLIEKYGVMSGFPDKTFRGAKSMTRYEMAAALYKVMTKTEEMIAKSNRPGYGENTNNQNSVSKEDIETISLLQKEFRNELSDLKGKVNALSDKLEKFNKVKISGQVELKYRDRVGVTDSTKLNSPLNGFDVDGDKGKTRFNDSIRNLITEYDRTPFRVKTSLDVNASWTPFVRYYGTFVADDGSIYKLGNLGGQAVGGHFGDEGLSGTSLYTQRSIVSIRSNFEDEYFTNAEKDNLSMKPLSAVGTSFYHDNKPGFGLAMGFMNFQNIIRPGTKFRNHFSDEKWIGHGYGLVGFGADDILVKDTEVKASNGSTIKVRNSVSRYWASGINASQVDPDSQRYNNVGSASIAGDITAGPLTIVAAANAGSPYVNRVAAVTNNLGSGTTAAINLPLNTANPVTPNSSPALSTTASPTGILTGGDFVNDVGGGLINEKVIVGTKDPLSPRNSYNLLSIPSEYGDGYGLLGLDLDLGFLRFGLNASDYWLDSTLSLSGTRKNISGVIDIGSNNLGVTVQANYNGIGVDTYSAGVFLNDLAGLDIGIGIKTGIRGLFNFTNLTGTNAGFYVVLPQNKDMPLFPKLMVAARQTFGDAFGTPKSYSNVGQSLAQVANLKDSGITLSASLAKIPGTDIGVDVEYNGLIEGSLLGFNFMAHDIGVFSTYKF